MSSEDGLLPQVVAPFLGPPDPACWGVGAGNGGARLSLGGGGARRKAAPTPLRLAPGLTFTWSHLISFHLELDLCHVRCHLRVLERASLGEQMLSESSLPRCPCRAQGPRREGNSSEEGSRFSVGAKRFPALCPTAPTKPSAPLGGPGSSAPGAVSLATLFTFRHGDQSRSRGPQEMEEGGLGAEAGAPEGGAGSVAYLAHHAGWWWEVQAGPQSWNVCGLGCAFHRCWPLPSSNDQLLLKLDQGFRSPAPV